MTSGRLVDTSLAAIARFPSIQHSRQASTGSGVPGGTWPPLVRDPFAIDGEVIDDGYGEQQGKQHRKALGSRMITAWRMNSVPPYGAGNSA
jgi:hypothetical protein